MKQKKEKVKESDEDSNPGPIGPAPHPKSEKNTAENNIQLIIKNTLSAPPPPPPKNPDEKVDRNIMLLHFVYIHKKMSLFLIKFGVSSVFEDNP